MVPAPSGQFPPPQPLAIVRVLFPRNVHHSQSRQVNFLHSVSPRDFGFWQLSPARVLFPRDVYHFRFTVWDLFPRNVYFRLPFTAQPRHPLPLVHPLPGFGDSYLYSKLVSRANPGSSLLEGTHDGRGCRSSHPVPVRLIVFLYALVHTGIS